ncbi:major capsid protein [Modestobacter sp. VKM Ac-2979]|uniref:major capsid protein n=1 Tax=unclassified Modestobacter TaxID=2643866 RepID=UPI0022AB8DB0|nr:MULTISPECIES: major capsid protein [unclassified Modestobacter]MCZ2810227.1 major capsid protein [Modestobacter sp. VKM Ac-2979]MCZ2841713.1 major capsid protein [Modestobacter sp. VKM Ac-2980]
MDRIKQLLGRVTELSDEELNELKTLILQAFEDSQVDPTQVHGEERFAQLEVLASAATTLKREEKRREDNVIRAHESRTILASLRDQSSPRSRLVVPGDRRPRLSPGGSSHAMTASGTAINDRASLAGEIVDALRSNRAANTANGRVLLARVHADRPAAQTLSSDDPVSTTAALDAAAEAHSHAAVQAIVAAGGLGAPEDTDYALPGSEVNDRPVKQSLPTFTTTRGAVRFMRPPTLADLEGAIDIWDVADDLAAVTDPTVRKPSLRVVPGPEILVTVQAVTNILTFGNLLARTYPEHIARVTDLAMTLHARIAEQQLLTQIGSLSTSVSGATGEGNGLGATRVLLPLLDRAATGIRNRLRTAPDTPLQLILPHWAKGILRSDLALQEPGDATIGISDAELGQYLASRNLAPTWALDGEAGQQFDPQAPGAVNAWPTSVVSYMFPAGAFQFLDGGTLDLGLVRDSTLNAANDFQMFSETFESVLFRGGEALRIDQALTPSGIARAAEIAA